jgi:NADPH:quinone reductase-like Zn-dependent oxidoreductase
MKALALTNFDTPPAVQDLPTREPGPGQVRVRVKAAGLNGMDAAISSGMAKAMATHQFPVVIGRDAAGIVDAVGSGVEHVSVGDEVLGHILFEPPLHHGTIAEYAVLPADAVVAMPASLDFNEAAALPLAGAAALAAVEAADVRQGQTVLIAGAGGGVGSFAIQLAVARGAAVIATGLPEDADRLRRLGASNVVDYRQDVAAQVLADHPEGVDALIDLVTFDPDTFAKLAQAVRPGGTVGSTTTGATPDALEAAGLTGRAIGAVPNRETLGTLLGEIERGALRVDVQHILTLDEATKGLEKLASRTARGKLVVAIDGKPQ